mmetsp:Transcript_11417/g.1711  ORF Transcript_11417/g.1711 Transcript_11417/m.1711 type:complete len:87 (+) Transcript_11417:176-436(+)
MTVIVIKRKIIKKLPVQETIYMMFNNHQELNLEGRKDSKKKNHLLQGQETTRIKSINLGHGFIKLSKTYIKIPKSSIQHLAQATII